jgi:uncharacterized membrane protein
MNPQDLATLSVLIAFAFSLFWMVIGWRAMRAHERIADASELAARKMPEADR